MQLYIILCSCLIKNNVYYGYLTIQIGFPVPAALKEECRQVRRNNKLILQYSQVINLETYKTLPKLFSVFFKLLQY